MLEDKAFERDNLFIEMQLCIKKNLTICLTLQLNAMDLTGKKLHHGKKQWSLRATKHPCGQNWKLPWIMSRKLSGSRKNWRRWADMDYKEKINELLNDLGQKNFDTSILLYRIFTETSVNGGQNGL